MQPTTVAQWVAKIETGELTRAERQALRDDTRAGIRAALDRARLRRRRDSREARRLRAMLSYEEELWSRNVLAVAGVDEVGAGPLAGPVYAAAVVLPPGTSIADIDDSKRLTADMRQELAAHIRRVAVAVAVASCTPEEIDTLNIYQASREAMRRAVTALVPAAEHLLVDARSVPGVPHGQTPIIKGDSRSQSIAAASIVAKVERDAFMEEMGRLYPDYGFEMHRGYATAHHLSALSRLGPCPIHRRSFAPVRDLACSKRDDPPWIDAG